MSKPQNTISKAEIYQLAEMLSIFQKLPPLERTAIQYYIKGRLDAMAATVEVPLKATAAAV